MVIYCHLLSFIVSHCRLPIVVYSYMSLGGQWFPTIRIYLVILCDSFIVVCSFVRSSLPVGGFGMFILHKFVNVGSRVGCVWMFRNDCCTVLLLRFISFAYKENDDLYYGMMINSSSSWCYTTWLLADTINNKRKEQLLAFIKLSYLYTNLITNMLSKYWISTINSTIIVVSSCYHHITIAIDIHQGTERSLTYPKEWGIKSRHLSIVIIKAVVKCKYAINHMNHIIGGW